MDAKPATASDFFTKVLREIVIAMQEGKGYDFDSMIVSVWNFVVNGGTKRHTTCEFCFSFPFRSPSLDNS